MQEIFFKNQDHDYFMITLTQYFNIILTAWKMENR